MIVLIGAPGAGKTTVGAILAKNLKLPYLDVDKEIERQVDKTISEIFADDGEQVFRELERSATLAALKTDGVVSLGGGAVMQPEIRAALTGLTVVWLEVSITQATRRIGMNKVRPLLLGNIRARLIELLRERTPIYRSVATLKVSTDSLTAQQVAEIIESELGDVSRSNHS